MATRRQILALGLAAAAAGIIGQSRAGQTAAEFIRELEELAVVQLSDPEIPDHEREERFRTLLHEHFDIVRICRFVLGRYMRRISAEEMAEFRLHYVDLAALTYAHLFASYAGQGFRVLREIGAPEDRYAMVLTEILPTDGNPPIKLDWQVLVDGGNYAVVDIRVEGASMAITQREEFTSVLERNGGDFHDLLKQLRAKIRKLRKDQDNR